VTFQSPAQWKRSELMRIPATAAEKNADSGAAERTLDEFWR
jgi:hypothetical protein